MPSHPEPHTYTWTKMEEEAIRSAMVAAYREGVEDAAKDAKDIADKAFDVLKGAPAGYYMGLKNIMCMAITASKKEQTP